MSIKETHDNEKPLARACLEVPQSNPHSYKTRRTVATICNTYLKTETHDEAQCLLYITPALTSKIFAFPQSLILKRNSDFCCKKYSMVRVCKDDIF